MELAAAFLIFAAGIAAALIFNVSLLAPLALGFVLFAGLALKKGYSLKDIWQMVKDSLRESLIVNGILLLIGCLTGLWRISGTIACFVKLGLNLLPPAMFLLSVFLLTSVMSYALGTSFGVTATAGVILMTIARAGGVNPVLAAGACLSGVYVGDRGSPAASSASLVAAITKTDLRVNIRMMLKNAVLPFLLCCVVYGLMSPGNPLQAGSGGTTELLEREFNLHWLCLLSALIMIVLPFCRVSVKLSMALSIAVSFALSVFLQERSVLETLRCMLLGYSSPDAELNAIFYGGGLLSMLEVCGIVLVSCTYGSIFRTTGMLEGLTGRLSEAAGKIGRFPLELLLSVAVCMIFCNQTVGTLMQSQLSDRLYSGEEKYRKMMDLENSVILIAGLVPWCIACSVPLRTLGGSYSSVPFAFFLWLVPLQELLRFLFTKGKPAVSGQQ